MKQKKTEYNVESLVNQIPNEPLEVPVTLTPQQLQSIGIEKIKMSSATYAKTVARAMRTPVQA